MVDLLRSAAVGLGLLLGLAAGGVAEGKEITPAEFDGITVNEQLGHSVDLSLEFTAEDGSTVRMGDFLGDGKPVLLTLNYYTCGTICGVQLGAVLRSLQDEGLGLELGEDFRVVTVSIDPTETPEIASEKRASYAEALGASDLAAKGELDWHFLTGKEPQIAALANSVGFVYRYDERTEQYAHPAVVTFLSPEGSVARYLYGLEYTARDLRFALLESAEGRMGSPVDKLILSCFRWDVTSGRYTPYAIGIMRLGGVVSMVLVGGLSLVLWRREDHVDDDLPGSPNS